MAFRRPRHCCATERPATGTKVDTTVVLRSVRQLYSKKRWCKTTSGVPVNGYSVLYLREGFTLLLVVGDLISVTIPGRSRPLLFDGMMFREGEPQQFTTDDDATEEEERTWQQQQGRSRPDGLAFIIAERASERGFTGSKDEDYWSIHFLENTMYSWGAKDVFRYIRRPWR